MLYILSHRWYFAFFPQKKNKIKRKQIEKAVPCAMRTCHRIVSHLLLLLFLAVLLKHCHLIGVTILLFFVSISESRDFIILDLAFDIQNQKKNHRRHKLKRNIYDGSSGVYEQVRKNRIKHRYWNWNKWTKKILVPLCTDWNSVCRKLINISMFWP